MASTDAHGYADKSGKSIIRIINYPLNYPSIWLLILFMLFFKIFMPVSKIMYA